MSLMLRFFEKIQHGDDAHKGWLRHECEAFQAEADSAIEAAAASERLALSAELKRRLADCLCATEPQNPPCAACMELARVDGWLRSRS